jgi:hypothetical protein
LSWTSTSSCMILTVDQFCFDFGKRDLQRSGSGTDDSCFRWPCGCCGWAC